MSGKSARSAMKRMNKHYQLCLVLAALLVAASAATAQQMSDIGPSILPPVVSKLERVVAPLNGVSSLATAEPTMIDARNAADCKLDAKVLREKLTAALVAEHLPLTVDTAPPRPDLLRLILKPQIATLKDGVVNCVSWVSLSAVLQDTLKIAPSSDRKPVTVTYWTRGALIMTPVVDHANGVNDVIEKLAHVLARQWRIDNPSDNSAGAIDAAPPVDSLNSIKR